MHWRPSEGIQSSTPTYTYRGKQLNAGWVTTFNSHAIVSENRITRITTSHQNNYVIPLFGCALTTALGVLQNEVQIVPSDSLLIFGAGGVGLLLIKIAKLLGITDITIVDLHSEKLKMALQMGASKTFLFTSKDNCLKEIKDYFDKNCPMVAIDTTGNISAIEICYEISAPKAKVILVGVPKQGLKASLYTLPLHFGKILKGTEGGRSQPETDIPYLLKLLESGKLNFNDYPTHVFSLNEINEAISCLKNGEVGRMIIDFSKS
jgi:Zn-dependent alcohol dehydrogenase